VVTDTAELEAAFNIICRALETPCKQILVNAGLKFEDIYTFGEGSLADGYGYNVKTGEYGDLVQMGVIDPFKVTRSALQNAISVATTILSTDAIITMARTYDAR